MSSDSPSLLKITSTGPSIWASDVRFMNDSSELSYAASLVQEIIDDVFLASRTERSQSFF